MQKSAWHQNYKAHHVEIDVSLLLIWSIAGIRDHVVQAVELKFNCFFLMPVVDSFPTRLREELESAYDDDIDEVFDVTAVRNALESRLKALESELHQVSHHSSLTAAAMLYVVHSPSCMLSRILFVQYLTANMSSIIPEHHYKL